MKKIVVIFLTVFLVLTCVGCTAQIDEPLSNREEPKASNPPVLSEEIKSTNNTQHLEYIEAYLEAENAPLELVSLYQKADQINAIPLLGTYLEETGKVMYTFYQQGTLTGVANMEIGINLSTEFNFDQVTSYYVKPVSDPAFVKSFSDEHCFMELKDTAKKYPNFEVLGLVYTDMGYPTIYPVGIVEGETTIKYLAGEPTEFNLVEPFSTLEEGRRAFAEFFAKKDAVKAQVPIFPWVTIPEYYQMHLRIYSNTNECYYENGVERTYMTKYDNHIYVPLVDNDLKEDVYALYLLFDNNDLIGQIVIERYLTDSGEAYRCAWEIFDQKSDGEYAPMDNIPYAEIVNAALQSGMEVEGVIFEDGEFIPYCHVDGEIVYYTE